MMLSEYERYVFSNIISFTHLHYVYIKYGSLHFLNHHRTNADIEGCGDNDICWHDTNSVADPTWHYTTQTECGCPDMMWHRQWCTWHDTMTLTVWLTGQDMTCQTVQLTHRSSHWQCGTVWQRQGQDKKAGWTLLVCDTAWTSEETLRHESSLGVVGVLGLGVVEVYLDTEEELGVVWYTVGSGTGAHK